jgi:hypothetical protein
MRGFEPPNGGTTSRCRNHLATLALHVIYYSATLWNWECFFIFSLRFRLEIQLLRKEIFTFWTEWGVGLLSYQ